MAETDTLTDNSPDEIGESIFDENSELPPTIEPPDFTTEDGPIVDPPEKLVFRCPIDSRRRSRLERSVAGYTCNCGCVFPIRNGTPVLLINEAELPQKYKELSQLPCRKPNRRKKRTSP